MQRLLYFKRLLPVVVLFVLSETAVVSESFQHGYNGISFEFLEDDNGLKYNILRNTIVVPPHILYLKISEGVRTIPVVSLQVSDWNMFLSILLSFKLNGNKNVSDIRKTTTGLKVQEIGIDVLEKSDRAFLYRVSRNLTRDEVARDCVDLGIGQSHWYGGPENRYQYYPVEKFTFTNYSYVTKETDNCALTERYWLNSQGIFIYIAEQTPLFIDQNSPEHPNQLCFVADKELPYDTTEGNFSFVYYVGVATNAREAHIIAVNNFLGKPSSVPDERMFRHPIWSTWALYKTEINETVVKEFSKQILDHNFKNSQLEIDDDWEVCYGALTFRESKFPNIKELIQDLKSKGFRITLWIHPFINKNCTPWYDEAKQNGYLVVDNSGNPDTQWWDSQEGGAGYIDFTNPAAAEWFSDRLKKLQNDTGIDSFKFDAGESSWVPTNPVLKGDQSLGPSLITKAYVRTVAQFGPMVEVRSGQGTQDLPVFVRMIDKDSEWGWNNGLTTLITTLLQMNLVGYPFVLPDMIGGNGYNDKPPTKELFIRWLQVNVFMPSLQFSFVPWQFDQETVDISLEMANLHDKYTNVILDRAKVATLSGEPVNPPLWWIAPDDEVAQEIYDQYLLGEDIIAAPVTLPNQEHRDIYLPAGSWIDGNTNQTYEGPIWLMNYPVPLKVLPFFIRAQLI